MSMESIGITLDPSISLKYLTQSRASRKWRRPAVVTGIKVSLKMAFLMVLGRERLPMEICYLTQGMKKADSRTAVNKPKAKTTLESSRITATTEKVRCSTKTRITSEARLRMARNKDCSSNNSNKTKRQSSTLSTRTTS